MLGLPTHVLDAIDHKFHNHGQPDRLLQVILMFLKQTEIPTWRLIIDALRSPTVNFLQLAKEVETAHFHNSTLEAIPQTTHGMTPSTILYHAFTIIIIMCSIIHSSALTESAATTSTNNSEDEVKSKPIFVFSSGQKLLSSLQTTLTCCIIIIV